jgi:hypothetical protein
VSRKRNRSRRRNSKSDGEPSNTNVLQVGKWSIPFTPKKGLFFFLFGFPIFFGLRLIGQWASGDTENIVRYLWWALLMAFFAGLLGTFTKFLDD